MICPVADPSENPRSAHTVCQRRLNGSHRCNFGPEIGLTQKIYNNNYSIPTLMHCLTDFVNTASDVSGLMSALMMRFHM